MCSASADRAAGAAFVQAAKDSDATVRNNATRALIELLRADPSAAARVPPEPFIDLLRYGNSTDRNKSSFLLSELTRSRDPKLLIRLKALAWEALMEIAIWRSPQWAFAPRSILARIQGIPEDRIEELSIGSVQAFLDAIHTSAPHF
jgi:hypothetical protein